MKVIFLIMVLVVSGNSYAEEDPVIFVHGIANKTCGEFISDRGWDGHAQYFGYINGFITGIQYAEVNLLVTHTKAHDWLLWIKNYCDEHPLTTLINAMARLERELRKRQ